MLAKRVRSATVDRGVQALADEFREVMSEAGAMVAQQCDSCGSCFFPPLLACSQCHADKLSWIDCGPTGTVGTFVTVHARTVTSSMSIPKWLADRTPYSSVYVVPDFAPSIRVPALMEGAHQERLAVGARVRFDLSDPRSPRVHLVEK